MAATRSHSERTISRWSRLWRDSIAIPAVVSVAEITGSESFIHLDAGEHRFVAQVPGVRRLEPGSAVTIYPDPKHLFVFDEAGRLRAAELARVA